SELKLKLRAAVRGQILSRDGRGLANPVKATGVADRRQQQGASSRDLGACFRTAVSSGDEARVAHSHAADVLAFDAGSGCQTHRCISAGIGQHALVRIELGDGSFGTIGEYGALRNLRTNQVILV